jgi:hypothetical protein
MKKTMLLALLASCCALTSSGSGQVRPMQAKDPKASNKVVRTTIYGLTLGHPLPDDWMDDSDVHCSGCPEVPGNIAYEFDDNGNVAHITVLIGHASYDQILVLLKSKFGVPSLVQRTQWHNDFGLVLPALTYTWNRVNGDRITFDTIYNYEGTCRVDADTAHWRKSTQKPKLEM